MLFADFLGDLFGWGCAMFIVICWGLGWLISQIARSDVGKDAAKMGFWWWLNKDN